MVSKTSELLPDPETPVNTVSRRFGISRLTSLRLFTRAPCTRIRSWLSATGSAADCGSVLVMVVMASPSVGRSRRRRAGPCLPDARRVGASAQLLDPDQVAGRVAEGAVTNPVRLDGRLLDDLGIAGLHSLERRVEVLGGEQDPAVGALGHHLGDGATLVVGDAGIDGRR